MIRWRRIPKPVLIVIVAFLVVGVVVFPYASYLLADYEYERIVRADPKTKAEVERLLFLCTARQIDIKASSLRHYSLGPGEVCYQYLVLGREPIEAVYDAAGQVKTIFCSYE
jgi:hypothetical protein